MVSDAEHARARRNWYLYQKAAHEMQQRLDSVRRTLRQIENPERMAHMTPAVLVHMLEEALNAAPVPNPDTERLKDAREAFDAFLESRQRLYQAGPLMGPLREVQVTLDSSGV